MTRPFVKSDPSPQDIFMEAKCGCGERLRYGHSNGKMSCNKYVVCPTYEELNSLLVETSEKFTRCKVVLEKIVGVNGMDYEYKTWAKEVLDKLGD